MTRTCSDCPSTISRNSTGRCRACALTATRNDPVIAARRRAGLAKAQANPAWLEAVTAGAKRGAAKRMLNPEYRERLARQGRTDMAQCRTPQARAKAAKAFSDQANAWCPPELRAFNEQLRAAKYTIAERKLMVAEEAERLARAAVEAERRRVAALPLLERQLEQIARGARVIEVHPMPSRRHDFSLTGCATGML